MATNETPVVKIESLAFSYPAKGGEARPALRGVTFDVRRGEAFALLGPNGGGKTTLFRILATMLPPGGGRVELFGHDLASETGRREARRRFGVVFQSPSLDKKLTVLENLIHHGHFFGMRGAALREKARVLLAVVGLTDREGDLAETLSGGMKRRAELAKSLLPNPELLLLDEPTTGLDPGARRDFWRHVEALKKERGATILYTTHFLDEAERADRVGFLSRGALVALGTPDALKAEVGGEVILAETADSASLAARLKQKFGVEALALDGAVRFEKSGGARFVAEMAEAFPGEFSAVSVGKPTLEDVFVRRTGRRFYDEEKTAVEAGAP